MMAFFLATGSGKKKATNRYIPLGSVTVNGGRARFRQGGLVSMAPSK